MTTAITRLDSPIDAMACIHQALQTEAAYVQHMAEELQEGGTLEPFRQAFYRWVLALSYHADMEDTYMTPRLPGTAAARDCEDAHRQLAARLDDVQRCLTDEIGRTMVIARTQRHLFRAVVLARIAQDDHLEEEEAFVLPIVRRQLCEAEQLVVVGHLLFDQDADDPRWPLEWLTPLLIPRQRQLIAELAAAAKRAA